MKQQTNEEQSLAHEVLTTLIYIVKDMIQKRKLSKAIMKYEKGVKMLGQKL